MIDINLLPKEHRSRPTALPLTIVLIILSLVLCYSGTELFLSQTDAASDIDYLQVQLTATKQESEQVTADTTFEEYTERIEQLEARLAELEAIEESHQFSPTSGTEWWYVFETVYKLAPYEATLTEISSEEEDDTYSLTVSGETWNNITVIEFGKRLESSGLFSSVALTMETEEEDGEEEEITTFDLTLNLKSGGAGR